MRDRIEGVAVLVGAVLADQIAVEHLVECLGKVEIHHVVVLHHDLVDGDEGQRIVDIAHQIEHKDLDIVHASDGRRHESSSFWVRFWGMEWGKDGKKSLDLKSISYFFEFFNSFVCILEDFVI